MLPATMESIHIAKVRKLPQNSLIRRKALAIVAMRLEGRSNEDIAKGLEISERSINQYLWMAGKNGWLPKKKGFVDPKDSLEFDLAHTVIQNLKDAMGDETRNEKTGMPVKTEVALEVAKGTLFKRFGDVNAAPPPSTILALRIEMPVGVPTVVREGTTGGAGRWQEAELVGDDPS
jgi:DNA-binding CsgD family transcriptional regulator